jgi:hypothetical protein
MAEVHLEGKRRHTVKNLAVSSSIDLFTQANLGTEKEQGHLSIVCLKVYGNEKWGGGSGRRQ